MWEIKTPPPPIKIEERQPQARLFPSTPSKVTGPIPQLGHLLQAVWNEDIPRIRDLLGKGADPNGQTSCGTRPLLVAAKKGNPEIIKILIENGAKVDGRDRNGLTPMMSAASVRQTRSIEVLIDAGADLNAKDNKGFTAIMWATMKGFPEVVEVLFSSGADLNVKTTEGLTAKRLSQRIIADLKRPPGEGERPDKEVTSRLTRHEQVLKMLESAGGE
jgi:ankyrin repeat protein